MRSLTRFFAGVLLVVGGFAFVTTSAALPSIRLRGNDARIEFDNGLALSHDTNAVKLSGGSLVITDQLFVQNGAVNVVDALDTVAAQQKHNQHAVNVTLDALQSQLDTVAAQQKHNQHAVNVTLDALQSQLDTIAAQQKHNQHAVNVTLDALQSDIVALSSTPEVPHKGDWTFSSPSSLDNQWAIDGVTNDVAQIWTSSVDQSPAANLHFVIDFGRVCDVGGVHLPLSVGAQVGASLTFQFSTDASEPVDWSVVPVSATSSTTTSNYQFGAVYSGRWMKVSQVGSKVDRWSFTDVFVTEFPARGSWTGPSQLMDSSFATYYNPGAQVVGHFFVVDMQIERRVAGVNFSHRNTGSARSLEIRTATGSHAPIHWHTIAPAFSCVPTSGPSAAYAQQCPASTANYVTASYRFNAPVLARYLHFLITDADAAVWQVRGMFVFSQ